MRRITAISLVGIALLLTGCGLVPGTGPDPRVEASPVAEVACPETSEDGDAEPGLVPADFTPVALLRCDPYTAQADAEGTWSGALLERREGDLAPVLAALAQPSDPRSMGPCPAVAYMVPELWLEGADGTVIRVAIPTDGCGAPRPVGLDEALAALEVTAESFLPMALVESSSATAAGCATQAQFLVFAGLDDFLGQEGGDATPESTPLPDDALVPMAMPAWPDAASSITGARLCDYTAVPPSQSTAGEDTTTFVGARELDADAARDLTALARTAPAAPSCTATATTVVVVHLAHTGGEVVATVELDGCTRLVDPGLQARTAPAAVLSLLTPLS